jgi:hypothetical protein
MANQTSASGLTYTTRAYTLLIWHLHIHVIVRLTIQKKNSISNLYIE